MKKDLVIGLVGTAILVAAMVGVFRFEAAQTGSAFAVTFSTATIELTPVEGATNEGESSLAPVEMAVRNATALVFELSWTDDTANSLPDEFEMVVVAPDGTERSVRGDASPLRLAFDALNVAPPEARLRASSPEAAAVLAARDFSSGVGIGTWNVTVALVIAGDVAQATNPLPIAQDTGNTWRLTPRVTAYNATIAPG